MKLFYNSDGTVKVLPVSALPANAVWNGGFPYTPEGSLLVSIVSAKPTDTVSNGGFIQELWGGVCAGYDTPSIWIGGLAITSYGALCLDVDGGIVTDGPALYNSLTHTAIPARGSIVPSFTRATTATGQKWDEAGYLDFTALAGEIVFKGAWRVYNQWTTSSVSLASGANKSLTLTAGTYQFSMGAGTGTATFSGTGGATGTLGASASGRVSVAKTITAGTFVVTASVADLADLQVCNITGETDQTTIRPYVSVGVESAPAYHGSMVDGVKCYDTDRDGALLPSAYTYNAVSLNGVAGTYVSTPDTALPGDIDLRCKLNMADWSPSTDVSLISKDNGVSREFEWLLRTDGLLWFYFTNDGSSFAGRVATSSAALTAAPHNFAVNGTYWVRVTYVTSTGKVNFYTSTDGSSWTALGAEQTTTSGTIYAGTSVVEVGSYGNGAAAPLSGSIHRAQIYNGIDGTLAVDFDASRYAGGTTLTGSTGETWTLQGNAVIHPTNSPNTGYVPWEARTNLLLQSAVVATQSITVAAVAHTLSFKGTGTITLSGVSAAGPLVGTGANDRVTLTFTPTAGSLTLTVSGSCTVGQLEAGSFATPYIPTTTVAVARNKDEFSETTSGAILTAGGTISLTYIPYHSPVGTIALWGTYVDSSNYTAILHDATNLIFRKRIAGVNYDATIANAFTSGTTYKMAASWGAGGSTIHLNGVAGTPHANTTAAQIAATMQVGADGNSLQQPGAGTTNLRIWQRQLSSPEGVAVTA